MTADDVNARSQPHLDQAIEFDRDDGLAHCRARHLEGVREFTLRRQGPSDLVNAFLDGLGEPPGDSFVESAWFGHGEAVSAVHPRPTSDQFARCLTNSDIWSGTLLHLA